MKISTAAAAGRVAGRRILVTGAASGIGLATARLLLAEGARVAMLDRDGPALQAATPDAGACAIACDVSDESQVAAAVTQAVLALGGLDGIVNCAGVSSRGDFGAVSTAEWTRILAVNLNGPFFVCRSALPHLRAAGSGTIVNVASGVAMRPIAGCVPYTASKGGLIAFGKALAVDLAPVDIRVNTVCPGIVDTPVIRRNIEANPDPEAEIRRLLGRRLLQRFGTPEEIAQAVLFLTAGDCAYVTGSVLAVDGGVTMH